MQRKVIGIDAMNTIFIPTHGRWELYKVLFKKLIGMSADPREIERAYKKTRRQTEQQESPSEEKLPQGFYRRYWGAINASIMIELFPNIGKDVHEIGERIALEVLGNPQYYRVSDDAKTFLGEASNKGYKVYIASNHEANPLQGLLNAFSLQQCIVQCIVSDEIGYKKPEKRFFEEALSIMGIPALSLHYIGNNPRNDMEGAYAAGIRKLYLYDPFGEHNDTTSSVEFTRIMNLNDIFSSII